MGRRAVAEEDAGAARASDVATMDLAAVDVAILEVTVLIPCLDEAETLGTCIAKARRFLDRTGIAGEILVADNGSTDGSLAIARRMGARVATIEERGYGSALRGGLAAARGRVIVMGDADDSYDFDALAPFVDAIADGADLVMGNRFKGGIAPGAMPFLHRYLGNPALSWLGRLLFRVPVGDFHCGLRAFRREAVLALGLRAAGMEFASEMVVKASLHGLRIAEVPTTLRKDGRSRPPHLNTWRDGWRHLRFLMLHSPRWTFVYPGAAAAAAGMLLVLGLLPGQQRILPGVSLDIRAFVVGCMLLLIGSQALSFGLIARRFAVRHALLPHHRRIQSLLDGVTTERLLGAAGALGVAGMAGLGAAVMAWAGRDFGDLQDGQLLRDMLLSLTAMVAAVQLGFTGLLLGVLDLPPDGDARTRLAILQARVPTR